MPSQGFEDSPPRHELHAPAAGHDPGAHADRDGDRDPLYPVEIFLEQYRAIKSAALAVLPNSSHDAVFREGRDFFVRAALAFLRG